MKRTAPITAFVAAFATSAASAQSLAHEDNMPRFCERQSHGVQRYYPARAFDNEQEGAVTLDCVLNGGEISSCAVTNETNPGWDFGAAALRIACRFHVQVDADGRPHLSAAPRDTSITTDANNQTHARSTVNFRLAPAAPPSSPPPAP